MIKRWLEWLMPLKVQAWKDEGYRQAVREIMGWYPNIHSGGLTVTGDQLTVTHCAFFGHETAIRQIDPVTPKMED